MNLPHVVPAAELHAPPSRALSLFTGSSDDGCQIALLGLPDDTGVRMNGGRPGAAEGPRAVREALVRYGVAQPASWRWPGVFDAGDVVPGSTLEETHDRVTAAVAAVLDEGLFPIGIGGGHDLTYPFVRAVAAACRGPMTGVYFDAHLDVRAEEGSGMPFRRLVERCGVSELYVHGMDPFANAAEHVQWFKSRGGHVDAFEPEDPWPDGRLFVSLDLDVIDQSYAPGVSATNPCGWTPALAERWVRAAGRCPHVRCFDMMELSPQHDAGGRTARLAARLLLTFLRGFSERQSR